MNSKPTMDVVGWEAFFHGVFAIAVTLLVLDIRVPDASSIDSGSGLLEALAHELPRYAAYVLGFLFVGTYWINMHRAMRLLRAVDHGYLILGLLFLMIISAVPFMTALLAEYIGAGSGQDQVALVIFTAWQLVLATLAYLWLRYTFRRRHALVRVGIPEASLRGGLRQTALGPLIWLVTLATALFASGMITLLLMTILLVVFMFEMPIREQPDSLPHEPGH